MNDDYVGGWGESVGWEINWSAYVIENIVTWANLMMIGEFSYFMVNVNEWMNGYYLQLFYKIRHNIQVGIRLL